MATKNGTGIRKYEPLNMSYPSLDEMPALVDVGFSAAPPLAAQKKQEPVDEENNKLKDEKCDIDSNIEIRTVYVP